MEAIGPVLVALSLPLLLRWIPPNPIYGFRVPATCRNPSVWYDGNALAARHLIALGLLMVVLEFVLPVSVRNVTLRVVGIGGLVLVTLFDWRTVNRWERERQQPVVRRN